MSSPLPVSENPDPAAESLFEAFQTGCRALAELLEQHRNYLMAIVSAEMLDEMKGRQGASDIVQDTFVAVLERIARDTAGLWSVHAGENLRRWLRRFVLNTLNNVTSHETADKRDVHRERSAGIDGVDPAARSPSVTSMVRRSERDERVDQAIENLPNEADRLLIRLRFWYDVPFPELGVLLSGDATDASRQAASRRIAEIRALLQMAELLGDWRDSS